MKKLFYGFAVLAAMASMFMTSCDSKIVSSEAQVDESRSAKVYLSLGIVMSDVVDAKADTLKVESSILVSTSYKGIYGTSTDNYVKRYTVKGSAAELDLPVKASGSDYTITFNPFVYDFTAKGQATRCVYKRKLGNTEVLNGLLPGEVRFVEVTYVSDGVNSNVK